MIKRIKLKKRNKRRNACIRKLKQNSKYLDNLKKVISFHKIEFERLQKDNYKNTIQYLLQIMHEELNNFE